MKKILLTFLSCCMMALAYAGTITIYRGGTALGTTYTNMAAAVAAAVDGDSVVLSADVFTRAEGTCAIGKDIVVCGTLGSSLRTTLDSSYFDITDSAQVTIRDLQIRYADSSAVRADSGTVLTVTGICRLNSNKGRNIVIVPPYYSVMRGGAIYSLGKVNLGGSVILDSNTAGDGGAIYAASDVVIAGDAVVLVYNKATQGGGAIYTEGNCTTTGMAAIAQNTAGSDGGGIYAGGKISVGDGGIIYANTSGAWGGGLYSYNGCSVSGYTILVNNQAYEGGGIYNYYGICKVSDNVVLTKNIGSSGSAVYSDSCLLSGSVLIDSNTGESAVSGYNFCSVSGNVRISRSEGSGIRGFNNCMLTGNVRIDSNGYSGIWSGGACNVSGNVRIDHNTGNVGAGIFAWDCTLSGNVRIEDNYATTAGGGLYTMGDVVIKDNVIITNNTCEKDGGGIYSDGSEFRMSGKAEVSHNTSYTGSGCGIFVQHNAIMVAILGGQIVNNSAKPGVPAQGAAVAMSNIGSLYVYNTRIYNPADDGGRQNEIGTIGTGSMFESGSSWWGSSDTAGLIGTFTTLNVKSWVVAGWAVNNGLPLSTSSFPVQAVFGLSTGAPLTAGLFPGLKGNFSASTGSFAPAVASIDASNKISSVYTAGAVTAVVDMVAYADADTMKKSVSVPGLGIREQVAAGGFNVYPNPSDGQIKINSQLMNDGIATAVVYDLSGRQVYTQELRFSDHKAQLDLTSLHGNYLLQVTNSTGDKQSSSLYLR